MSCLKLSDKGHGTYGGFVGNQCENNETLVDTYNDKISAKVYNDAMNIIILEEKISTVDLKVLAEEIYGILIKGSVDIVKDKVAIGGEYHIDSCNLLCENGSNHNDVWGFNIRFDNNENGEIEYDSLINIKPLFENKTRTIESSEKQIIAEKIIRKFIEV